MLENRIVSARHATRLLSVATAVPDHVIEQNLAEEHARTFFRDRMPEYDRLSGVFAATGIKRRYSVCPVSWFTEPHGWHDRHNAYVAGATRLVTTTVHRALEKAGVSPDAIDAVVTVSSTGIATPSLEARVLPALGFRSDLERVPVFGLGCAGGVTGLAIASKLAAAREATTVLLLSVELCTLAFRIDRATKTDLVSMALFGDGAAAAIVSSDTRQQGIANVTASTEHLWPDTLDIMGWSIDDVGLGVLLSRSLPAFVETRYRESYHSAMSRMGLAADEIDRTICHPGGARVIEAIETALDLQVGSLDHERSVMRDFGNMSSPTVFFVLERAIEAGLPPKAVLAALGPGFTASYLALAKAS